MKLSDLIGNNKINELTGKDISDTLPLAKLDERSEFYFDSSFFDHKDRVKNKYLDIPGFREYYKMSLNELEELTLPSANSRTIILGTTEYLLPYVAYCLKFIEDNKINIETGARTMLPFIIYAPIKWSMEDNLHTIDLMAYLYKHKYMNIRIIVPEDRTKLFLPNGNPRVTFLELFRLYKNLGNLDISIRKNGSQIIGTIKHKIDGGKRKKRRTRRLSKKQAGNNRTFKNCNKYAFRL
jgi:hypothetical protein